jgi:hypothetical protein
MICATAFDRATDPILKFFLVEQAGAILQEKAQKFLEGR